MTAGLSAASPPLGLLPYQSRLIDHLKGEDPDLWSWFASSRHPASQREDQKFELLKSTYRIERDTLPELYRAADNVAGQLGLQAPITIYQAQDPSGLGASLAYLPDELHLVLHGSLTTHLTPIELTGLIGHEFSHFLLWQAWNGELLIAHDLLMALTHDPQAHPAHFASLRLLQLYNEIFCDRGSLLAAQDLNAVVSLLVKIHTGVKDIEPESYLRQAVEIFSRGPAKTEGITHPEIFIRARAIKLWSENDPQCNNTIADMIESGADLQALDLLGQKVVANWTRRVIDLLLSHKWFQSDPVLAHARLYFDDYSPPSDSLTDLQLPTDMHLQETSIRNYFCYVLLDFVTADRDLDDPPLAAALQVAEIIGIKPRFCGLACQELRLRKNQLGKVDERKLAILQEADKSAASAP